MMDRMMRSGAQNPALAFKDVLSQEEQAALRTVTLTAAEEREIGRRMRDEYLRQARSHGFRLVEDERKLKYLRDLVAALTRGMHNRARYPKIEVSLIDAPIADGQSFPGGFLIFTTALLESPDEATVAGVVAHELAHVDLGHLNEYARRSKLADTAFQPPPDGFDPGSFSQFLSRGMAAGSIMMNPFRPEHELQADCQATTWMYQAGYDPVALVGFFERLNRMQNDQPDNAFFQFNRSHPYSLDRKAEVLDRLGQLRRWRDRDDLELFPENLRQLQARGGNDDR